MVFIAFNCSGASSLPRIRALKKRWRSPASEIMSPSAHVWDAFWTVTSWTLAASVSSPSVE
ncbi:hypothetical protein A6A29_21765 [Streptomyces sp. TSRI0281]|nr:hypothetical protein A6A29_21765 [Streptomyces sp. TSRI0281]